MIKVIVMLALIFSESTFAQSPASRAVQQARRERVRAARESGRIACVEYWKNHTEALNKGSMNDVSMSTCNYTIMQDIFRNSEERSIFIACDVLIRERQAASCRDITRCRSTWAMCRDHEMFDIFRNPEARNELVRCLDSIDRSAIPPYTAPAEHCKSIYVENHSISSATERSAWPVERPASQATGRAGARERSNNPPREARGVGSNSGASYGPAHSAGAID